MIEGADEGVRVIDEEFAAVSSSTMDSVALMALKAELLHLDGRDTDALAVFDCDITPHLDSLPEEAAVIMAENKLRITAAIPCPVIDEYYHLGDQRRLLDVPARDSRALLHAARAAEQGKHYEALPTYWQDVLRAYESLSWQWLLVAERDLAREYLQVGAPREAAYHAMLAQDEKTSDAVGKGLLAQGHPEVIRKTLDHLLGCSSLVRHATHVARLVATIADIIPDDRFEVVLDWLSVCCSAPTRSNADWALMQAIWSAVETMAPRLEPRHALRFAELAIAHPCFGEPNIHRRYLIRGLNKCVARVESSDIPRIVTASLTLTNEKKDDVDYTDAVNLLCHLAYRGDEDNKRHMKLSLYPAGAPIQDALLIQVAPVFGCQIKDPSGLETGAIVVANKVRQQVQWLEPGEEPARMSGWCIDESRKQDGRRLVVHIGGGQLDLEAVIAHRHLLSDSAIAEVGSAIIDMIADSENAISNRVSLVDSLRRLSDRLAHETAQSAALVLKPLAEGHIVESSASMSHADAKNPLNPFKMDSGDPTMLRAISLMALTTLEAKYPELTPELHAGLLLEAMADSNATVRTWAFAAARDTTQLSAAEAVAAIVGTADPDPQAAEMALSVFINSARMQLEDDTWSVLARCTERCAVSPYPAVRSGAARIAISALKATLSPGISSRLEAVKERLAHDICYSVRQAVC